MALSWIAGLVLSRRGRVMRYGIAAAYLGSFPLLAGFAVGAGAAAGAGFGAVTGLLASLLFYARRRHEHPTP